VGQPPLKNASSANLLSETCLNFESRAKIDEKGKREGRIKRVRQLFLKEEKAVNVKDKHEGCLQASEDHLANIQAKSRHGQYNLDFRRMKRRQSDQTRQPAGQWAWGRKKKSFALNYMGIIKTPSV
jgi:hypothetical protein